MAADAGFTTIDVDLIFGIEGQTKEALENDFITAFKSGATQVSHILLLIFHMPIIEVNL